MTMFIDARTGARKGKNPARMARSWLLRSAMIIPLALDTGTAFAQETDDIVVTAQRREQSVIDVPVAVSVLSAKTVQNLNMSNFTAIAEHAPNFNITQARGANAVPNLTIRGIRGDGNDARINESSVAVYVDDVYLGDESMLSGQMFDVQRVEVLRGPQGTLFGRNSTGGLVHFISAEPTDDLTGNGSILYGSDDWVNVTGAVSGALGEGVRTRLAGQFERHDGHFNNRATLPGAMKKLGARQVWSLRSTTDIDIGSSSSLRLQLAHSETDSQSQPGYGLGIWKNQPGPRVVCSRDEIQAAQCVDAIVLGGQPPQSGRRAGDAITGQSAQDLAVVQKLTSITAKFQTDFDWASLVSVTNFTTFKSSLGIDADAATTPSTLVSRLNARLGNRAKQFSQELRLQGKTQSLDWVTGVFYYQDRKKSDNLLTFRGDTGLPIALIPSNAQVDTESKAVFGQIDWHVADQWTLAVGARYSIESRELVEARFNNIVDVLAAVADPRPTNKDVTGRVSLTWEPTADNSLYASYSRGAKSVGYNVFYTSGSAASNAAVTGPVGQEHVDAFEIGSKNRLFDRTLTLNLAAFYYLFDGKQERLSTVDNSGPIPIVTGRFLNVGQSTIYGAELEATYSPNERWDFTFGAGLLETEITKSDLILQARRLGPVPLQGRPLPQTPKWNMNAIIAHHIPMDRAGALTLQAEARAQAKQNFGLSNDPLATAPSYAVVNLRMLWKSDDGKYNAQAFVTNLFNKAYFSYISDVTASAGSFTTSQAEPRLWGVKFGVTF